MIHAVRFYLVAPEKVSAFQAILNGELYRELTRHLQPGLIAVDLLRSRTLQSAYLTIEFWLNEETYLAAQRAPAHSILIKLLQNIMISCRDLGPFSFPPRVESDHQWQDVSTISVAHCIKGHGFEDA
jgi:quinol monooxygenase YgiN